MVGLRVPDVLRERLQNVLREIMQAVERLDKLYTHTDLLFDNSFTVVHSKFFSIVKKKKKKKYLSN